jgi:AAA ATPase domain
MDEIKNPYAPGAGTKPPALIGREVIIQDVQIALSRLKEGRNNGSFILVGLRGVGKTVLLRHLEDLSEQNSYKTIWIEASENKKLQDSLVPQLKLMLEKISFGKKVSEKFNYALRRLQDFASQFKFSYEGASLQVLETKAHKFDYDFETELYALLEAVSDVAKENNTAITLHIDEMQFLPEDQLQSLYKALHLLGQKNKPLMLLGAGLPQIQGKSGVARSYSERLFQFKEVGSLSNEDSKKVILYPAQNLGVTYKVAAINFLIDKAKGYPFFLQQFGSDVWRYSQKNPITLEEVLEGLKISQKMLDESFYKSRLDRSTPLERKYLRAMAELGDNTVRSGEIAALLGKEPQQLSPTRNNLIKKGTIYSPAYGGTAFTVPMFDEYLKRVLPHSLLRS